MYPTKFRVRSFKRSPSFFAAAITWGALLLGTPALVLAQSSPSSLSVSIDGIWVLMAAAMVFLMQAGFLALEAGSVREKAAAITALKNEDGISLPRRSFGK